MRESAPSPGNDVFPPGLPRACEIALVLLALPLVLPLGALAVLLVFVSSRGGPFFRQTRVGQGGRPFALLKFRTMHTGSRGAQVTVAGDARVTRIGRLLRAAKVDELPGLWNVLRGEMALVGPRPEVPSLVDFQSPLWRRVLLARPGLTDPVTLRLRNEEQLLAKAGDAFEEYYKTTLQPLKLRGYIAYLEGRHWWSDAGVLLQTVWAVLVPRRVHAPSHAEIAGRG